MTAHSPTQPAWPVRSAAVHRPLPDEQRVVDRARRGDADAFRAIVDRYGDAILGICITSTLRRADGEELAQDVFFAAWRGLSRFRGDCAFSTWLFALARNACVDHFRRNARRPALASHGARPIDVAAPDADPDSRRAAHAILQGCRELSLDKRQALLLRDLHGLSYEEIADIQDVPIGTVRSRIAAARERLAVRVER